MRYGLADDHSSRSQGASFPVQSSVLDEEALLFRVLTGYSIAPPDSCHFLTRGDADVYRVRTAGSNCYLKVYRPPRTLERTEAEAAFVVALSAAGIPVVKPVPRLDGRYAYEVAAPEGKRPLLLFEEAPPPLPAELEPALLKRIGHQVALFHAFADHLEGNFGLPEIQSDAFLRERVFYTSRFLSEQDQAYLCGVSKALDRALAQMPRQAPGFGLCHADLVLSNLRQAQDGTITLYDFGDAMKTWRAYELAVVYWSLGHRVPDSRDRLWQAFLQGYRRIRPFAGAWSDSLAAMLVLRQIGFLGGNCATLPLRLGTEPFETGFMEREMTRLRHLVDQARLLPMD